MRYLRGFGRFWYDFVVGDDWKLAVSVVLSLGLTSGLVVSGVLGDRAVALIGGAAVVLGFCVAMAVDARASRR